MQCMIVVNLVCPEMNVAPECCRVSHQEKHKNKLAVI